MTKILHTADIHLDSPLRSLALRAPELHERVLTATRTALGRIVDAALEHEVSALLIAGDLHDRAERSAKSAAFLATQFDRLRDAGIAVFLIKGNHDAENPVTGEVPLPDNVHTFDARGGKVQIDGTDIWVHGVSFRDKSAPDSLLPRFQPPVADAVNIAMLHTSLAGSSAHDVYAPCSVGDLAKAGFDYWALGHVHVRGVHSEAPWIVMPGTPQGRDIGEAGPKSATLLTIEDGAIAVSEVATSEVEFRRVEVDGTDAAGDDALRRCLRDAIRAARDDSRAPHAILRLTLRAPAAFRWRLLRDLDVWQETATTIAEDCASVWIEKFAFAFAEDRTAAPGTTATDELAALMDAIAAEPGFAAQARAETDAILSELPSDRRTTLIDAEDALDRIAQTLAGEGAAAMVARMKGAQS